MNNVIQNVSIGNPFFNNSKAYLVGISNYISPHINNLSSPVKDVTALKEVLQQHHGFKIEEVAYNIGEQTFSISNPLFNCSSHTLLKFIGGIQAEKEDRLLFYFAGHGIAVNSDDHPEGFLLTSNAKAGQEKTFVKMSDVMLALNKLSCKHLLVILDCCYAGTFRWSERTRRVGAAEIPKTIYYERFEQYTHNQAWQVLTSSAHDQTAIDTLGLGKRESSNEFVGELSPFAEKLLEALKTGDADFSSEAIPKDGIITAAELCLYLENSIFRQLHDAGIRREKRQVPMLFPLEKHNKGQFVFLNPQMTEGSRIRLQNKSGRNPYKGLGAYGAGDNNLFYGRGRVIEDGWSVDTTFYPSLKEVTLTHKVILVTGPSGIGKSSLVRAGVLPLCKELGCTKWHEIRPGKKPYNTNEFFFAERQKDLQPSIILIDQYEELITECNNENERIAFEQELEKLKDKHIIIVTIRSDFEAHFKDTFIAPAAQCTSFYRFVVPPFSRQELKEIVTQPATQEVLEFKPYTARDGKRTGEDFINRIVDEANQQPGSLPLLSLALSELYEKRDGVSLLEKVYNDFSGITNIIERKATEAYNQYVHKPGMQQLFKFLVFRMISLDGGEIAKRKIFTKFRSGDNNTEVLNELSFTDSAKSSAIHEIKMHLEKERLLNSGTDEKGNEYTEPAHDALLRSWPMLMNWLNENATNTGRTEKNNLLLHEAVKDIAVEYRKETDLKRKSKYLWKTDPRLGLARRPEIMERLNGIESDFIEDSYKARIRSKRRNIAMVTAAFFVIATVAAIAIVQAKIARAEANRNQALYLASESEKYLPSDAIRLLEYAYDLAPGETSVLQKMQALTGYATDLNLFTLANMEHPREIIGVDYNERTKTMVSVCHQDSVARLWNLKGEMTVILKPPHPAIIAGAFFLHNRENNIILLSRSGKYSFISVFAPNGKLVRQNKILGEVSNLSYSFYGTLLFGKIFSPVIDNHLGATLFSIDMKDSHQLLSVQLLSGTEIYPYINSDSFIIKDGSRIRVYEPCSPIPVRSFNIDPGLNRIIFSKFGNSILFTDDMESKVQIIVPGDTAAILNYRSDIKKMILSNNGEINIWYQDSMFYYSGETNVSYRVKSEGEKEYSFFESKAGESYFQITVNKEDEHNKPYSDEDITTTIRLNDQYKTIRYNGVFFASFDSLGSKKLSFDNNVIRLWDFNAKEFDSRNFSVTETRLAKYVDESKKIYIFSNMDEDADTVICTVLDKQFNYIDELHLPGSYYVIDRYPFLYALRNDSCILYKFNENKFVKVSQTLIGQNLENYKVASDNQSVLGMSNNNTVIKINLSNGTVDSFSVGKKTIIMNYYEIAGNDEQLFIVDTTGNYFIITNRGKLKKYIVPNEYKENITQSPDKKYLSFSGKKGLLLLNLSTMSSKTAHINKEAVFSVFFFPASDKMIVCTRNYNNYFYDIKTDKLQLFYAKDYLSSGDYASLETGNTFFSNEITFSENGKFFMLKNEKKVSLFNASGEKMVDYDLSLLGETVIINLAQNGNRFLALTDDNIIRQVYTPAGIREWLRNSKNIPPLSDKLKNRYGLTDEQKQKTRIGIY